ncbi:MAG TPA: MerR family transcriptional regulator [Paracoccaceae bacterium]|nr:MerR family transcriptional regulator [Paracoccaceae bacterium]
MPPVSSPFDDGKAPDAMRTIGEVAAAFGIRQHILRYWEQQFPMLKPLKRSGGRRLYRPHDVALVRTIDRLVNRDGYTLKGARAVLEEAETPAARALSSDEAIVDMKARLLSIRNRLSGALKAA